FADPQRRSHSRGAGPRNRSEGEKLQAGGLHGLELFARDREERVSDGALWKGIKAEPLTRAFFSSLTPVFRLHYFTRRNSLYRQLWEGRMHRVVLALALIL